MQSRTLEPKPTREVIDQVFLSPRVLDKAAFEEFTGIIKNLIERAAEDTRRLQAAATQAEAVHKRLAESAPLIESRLTGAGAAIATLDARTSEVRAALGKTTECALRAEQAQANAERLASEGLAQIELRLAAAVQGGQTTLENVKATVEMRAREIAESALRAIEAAGTRLQDLEAQSAARLTQVVEQADQSLRDLEERLNQITGRIATLAGVGLGGIAALCDRATAILGYDPAAPEATAPAPGSLGDIVRQAEHTNTLRIQNRTPRQSSWCESPAIDPTEPSIAIEESTGAPVKETRAGRMAKAKLRAKPAKARPSPRRRKR